MNYTWNLDGLYTSTESEQFKKDMGLVDQKIDELNHIFTSLNRENETKTIRTILEKEIEFSELVSKLFEYISLNMSTDSTNSTYASLAGLLQSKLSKVAKAQSIADHYIAQTEDLEKCIAEDELLTEHKHMLLKIKKSANYMLHEDVEETMSKLDVDGVSAWGNLQDYLTSTVKVDFKGETTNLSAIRNMAYSEDATLRKEAYEAELAAYDKIKDAVAFSLNSIKGNVNTVCEMRGYTSPLDRSLQSNNLKKESLDAMFAAIDDYLPKFHAYLRRKGELLGHENGLPWYDLFAPMGKSSSSTFTIEQSKDYLLNQFKNFSQDLCDMICEAYDNEWIDFLPHSGKSGGAFCAGVHSLKQSRILTNFDGSLSDVVTLAHELGHAYHNLHTFDHSIINNDIPMPLAETASTFNETVVMNSAIQNAKDKDEKLKLIESSISDSTQIICDIYSRYLFESEVFEKRNTSFMYAKELEEIMLNAQKKAYGNGLDHNYLHPYMWVCKGHYYSTYSFYNYPYAFGGLFARGLYAKYEKEGAETFVPSYQKLLNATSQMDAEEVAMMAGIDITSKDFWCSSLESISKLIDEFMELTK